MKIVEPVNALLRRLRELGLRAAYRRQGMLRIVNGTPLHVDPRARRVFTPEYDSPVAAYLKQPVEPGSEIWNAGANVGVVALQMASWLRGAGKVVAFEPNPAAARLLCSNIRYNRFEDCVEVIESAVGERAGLTNFYVSGTGEMGRAGTPNPSLERTETIRVPVITLDGFALTRGRLPAWVVMDIEGWEIAALRGARRLLLAANLVVELHPSAWEWSGHCRADLESLIAECELEVLPLAGQSDPLAEHGHVLLRRRSHTG
jgi:FkbM family methyltransferase